MVGWRGYLARQEGVKKKRPTLTYAGAQKTDENEKKALVRKAAIRSQGCGQQHGVGKRVQTYHARKEESGRLRFSAIMKGSKTRF